jgi:hypothetical protein
VIVVVVLSPAASIVVVPAIVAARDAAETGSVTSFVAVLESAIERRVTRKNRAEAALVLALGATVAPSVGHPLAVAVPETR